MSPRNNFPPPLIKEIKKHNVVPFIGAGVSVPCGGPTWSQIIFELLKDISADFEFSALLDEFADNLKINSKKKCC